MSICATLCLDAVLDPIITPELFAQSVVDDYQLAPSYHAIITKSIQEQLSDYKAHSATFGEDGVMIDENSGELRGGVFPYTPATAVGV